MVAPAMSLDWKLMPMLAVVSEPRRVCWRADARVCGFAGPAVWRTTAEWIGTQRPPCSVGICAEETVRTASMPTDWKTCARPSVEAEAETGGRVSMRVSRSPEEPACGALRLGSGAYSGSGGGAV